MFLYEFIVESLDPDGVNEKVLLAKEVPLGVRRRVQLDNSYVDYIPLSSNEIRILDVSLGNHDITLNLSNDPEEDLIRVDAENIGKARWQKAYSSAKTGRAAITIDNFDSAVKGDVVRSACVSLLTKRINMGSLFHDGYPV